MKIYHEVWLAAHPQRSREWLAERLRDGFDVHHMDGNHDNNDPANLVLIEGSDHMMLHGGRALRRLGPPKRKGKRQEKVEAKLSKRMLRTLEMNAKHMAAAMAAAEKIRG